MENKYPWWHPNYKPVDKNAITEVKPAAIKRVNLHKLAKAK